MAIVVALWQKHRFDVAVLPCKCGNSSVIYKGKNEEKFATVKRMLKRGKNSLDEIAEDTELPLATIKQIQAEMHTA